jgi:hypothetical protein
MKKHYSIWISVLVFTIICACQPKTPETAEVEAEGTVEEPVSEQRPSPLEVKEGKMNGKQVKIQYGSPSVKGRTIWGDLVPYNVVWRTGANEATYIDFSSDMVVEGQPIKAGKYSIFTIPKESGNWTVIFNSDWDLEHGHFQYNEKNDVLRVDVAPVWESTSSERLSIDLESPGIVIRWEKLKLPVAIQ